MVVLAAPCAYYSTEKVDNQVQMLLVKALRCQLRMVVRLAANYSLLHGCCLPEQKGLNSQAARSESRERMGEVEYLS